MSALALKPQGGILYGLAAPSAGPVANKIDRLTVRAVEQLKAELRAGSSLAFNDLQTLARENDIEIADDPTFLLAQRFLLALPTHLPSPEPSLDADGEVSFDWRGPRGRLLTVTLRQDGRLTYASRFSKFDKEHGTKQFVDSIPRVVLDRVRQVAEG